jgi:hypothetical protein
MSVEPEFIQRAIEDLATVRKAIEAGGGDEQSGRSQASLGANLLLQVSALVAAAVILVAELVSGNFTSEVLRLSAVHQDLRVSSIFMIGFLLAIMVGALYFVVYRASRASQRGSGFSRFVARNFSYLKNLSFLSDLLIKFAVLALLIHVRQPQWVAPLLFVFIGDYLIQGRFFTLPLRLSLVLGAACLAAAAAQAYLGSSLLRWPLAGFVVVCALSLVQVIRLRRADLAASKAIQ